MLIFMLNVSISMINALGVVGTYSTQPQQQWINDVGEQALQDEEYFQSVATQDVSTAFGFGDFLKGLVLFVTTFAVGVLAPAYILTAFGVPTAQAILWSLPFYPVYALALSQYISNRNTKSMD